MDLHDGINALIGGYTKYALCLSLHVGTHQEGSYLGPRKQGLARDSIR